MIKIIYHRKFYKSLKRIPISVIEILQKKEDIFKNNPFDERIRTHKLNGIYKERWSFSINYTYRVIFKFQTKQLVEFIDIGTHEIYK